MNDLQATIDACWPAERMVTSGPWTLRISPLAAGSRVNSLSGNAPDQIEAGEDLARAHDRRPGFIIMPGQEALDAALAARGYVIRDAVNLWTVPTADLTEEVMPYATAFTIWPPLRIQRDIWASGNIRTDRQGVMARAANPAAVLGRADDRAAGAAFVAAAGDTAMLSAVLVLPERRRKGVGANMLRAAAHWAKSQGCSTMALVCERDNAAANATYAAAGMTQIGGYHYRRPPEDT